MSLQVPQTVVESVLAGKLMPVAEFIEIISNSLPLAWPIFTKLAERKKAGETGLVCFAPAHMEDDQRGQLLRAMASEPIRNSLEEHFGLRFRFQNCHITAVFFPEEVNSELYKRFTSREAQILAQTPEMVHC